MIKPMLSFKSAILPFYIIYPETNSTGLIIENKLLRTSLFDHLAIIARLFAYCKGGNFNIHI